LQLHYWLLLLLLLIFALHFLPLVPLDGPHRGIQYRVSVVSEADGDDGLFGSRCRWDFMPGS
jgi:hypothetical protein